MAMAGRRPFDRRFWFVVIGLAIAGIGALALDIPVTLFLKTKPLHR